jgi:hypothetical protein
VELCKFDKDDTALVKVTLKEGQDRGPMCSTNYLKFVEPCQSQDPIIGFVIQSLIITMFSDIDPCKVKK